MVKVECDSIEYINGRNKTNIKNRTYYFYNDQIDLKDFDARLLKIDKEDHKKIDIYYIGYVTIKKIGDYNNIKCKSFVLND